MNVKMINSKKRFEILKRDWFRCMYCGRAWKDVSLEVDHIIPKSKWWTDNMDNLITCCRECNMWKWNTMLEEEKWYKYIINEHIKKMKSAFYNEWNKRGLGTIDDKTTWLLSTVAKLLIWWDTYKMYLDMPAWFSWDLSEYKDTEWNYNFEKLDKLFKTWGEYCDFVMCLTEWESWFGIEDIKEIIERCSMDEDWSWPKKDVLSLRLNYVLSELCWTYEIGDNYLIKKYSLFPNLLKND